MESWRPKKLQYRQNGWFPKPKPRVTSAGIGRAQQCDTALKTPTTLLHRAPLHWKFGGANAVRQRLNVQGQTAQGLIDTNKRPAID